MSQQGQGDVGRRDIVLRLEDIADASLREDGTDIPLGEQLREAAREITRLRTLLSSSRGEQGKAHTAREVLTYLYSESKWEEDVDGDIGGPIVNHNVRIRDSLLDELLDMADIPRGRYDETPLKRLVRANEEDQNDTSPSAHGSVQTSAAQGWREALVTASMALTAHNDWQLKRTDPEVLDGVEYIPAEAYAESTLYELTDDALSRIKACEDGSVPTSLAGQVPDEVLSTIGDAADLILTEKRAFQALANRIRELEEALSAERLRVIEECAKVIENWPTWDLWRGEGAAALRALGQQDTGGADV